MILRYWDVPTSFIKVEGYACSYDIEISPAGFIKVGGYKELVVRYMEAIPNSTLTNPNTTCGYPREDSWILLRNPVDSDMPWPAFLLGQTPASIWYWCADQVNWGEYREWSSPIIRVFLLHISQNLSWWWGGWGCEVSCIGHHRLKGKTTMVSALDGAVFDIAQILAYLVHNRSRSQLYLGFGHFGWIPPFFGQ